MADSSKSLFDQFLPKQKSIRIHSSGIWERIFEPTKTGSFDPQSLAGPQLHMHYSRGKLQPRIESRIQLISITSEMRLPLNPWSKFS